MSIIEFQKVSRIYHVGDHEQKALDNIDLNIEEGIFIVILGPSGAGKSTLLNMLGGLDSPTSGKILVEGYDIANLNNDELADNKTVIMIAHRLKTVKNCDDIFVINERKEAVSWKI